MSSLWAGADPAALPRTPRWASPDLFTQARALGVRPALEVGAVDDPLEAEADRVATEVTGVPKRALRSSGSQSRPSLHPADETSLLARIASPSTGRALSAGLRGQMESAFGADFSQVRLHDGAQERADAAALGARAFTHYRDIWLGREASDGDHRLLAHELTHVVQQGGAGPTTAAASAAPLGVGSSAASRPGNLVQRDTDEAAERERVSTLERDYQTLVQARDWRTAAERLNGFNREDIQAHLAALSPEQIADMHTGAIDNPHVGPDSQVARLTEPGLPAASTPPPISSEEKPAAAPRKPPSPVAAAPQAAEAAKPAEPPEPAEASPPPAPVCGGASTVADLDLQFKGWVAEGNWQMAAETLNGFNYEDMHDRLTAPGMSDLIADLHQGALDNPRLGRFSQVAFDTAPGMLSLPPGTTSPPMGGEVADYQSNPDYIDNFAGASYDPLSNTLHLFFDDGGEAVVLLPLRSTNIVRAFERKSLLYSPGPNDQKIYPTILNKNTVPNITQWLADHADEMGQSAALAKAGAFALKGPYPLPENLWWLPAVLPAARLGARFSSARMRPSRGSGPQEGETPVIRTPTPKAPPAPATVVTENAPVAGPVIEGQSAQPTPGETPGAAGPLQESQPAPAATIPPERQLPPHVEEPMPVPYAKNVRSTGELVVEWTVLTRFRPDAKPMSAKSAGFDFYAGNTQEVVTQVIEKDGTVTTQTAISGGEWGSVKGVSRPDPDLIAENVFEALDLADNALRGGRMNKMERTGPNTARRTVYAGPPEKITIFILLKTGSVDEALIHAADDIIARSTLHTSALPPVQVVIAGQ